jgi:C1A family cysteine protease
MKSFLALAVLSFICVVTAISYVPGNHVAFEQFAEFMRTYNKTYETAQEFQMRFKNFVDNLAKIDELNAKATGTARYAVNKFSDMSAEEFRRYPCGVDRLSSLTGLRPNFKPNLADLAADLSTQAIPTNFDWSTQGAVTPVKDQGQCGSCWAFSTIGNIEGVNYLANKQLVGLSEQEEVDCSHTSYGCGGGWPFWAMSDILANPINGVVDTESGYPYTAEDGTCAESTSDEGTTITSYKSYCTEETAACDEGAMAALLVQVGPLSACLDATPMQSYTGGIDNPQNCDPTYIDHCITIVGYGVDSASGLAYWKIKNSWGTSWGEEGYYYLIRGTGACGINKVITVATV